MRRKRRDWKWLIISVLATILLSLLVLFVPPASTYAIHTLQLPVLPLFFLGTAVLLFSLMAFVFKSKKHGVLVSIFVNLYLLFRLGDLTHPFFLVLLLALFFTLELLFTSKQGVR